MTETSHPPHTKRARALRQVDNAAEARIWHRLRNRQLGHKFRRQHPIGSYFADFACLELKLVVEIDGSQHNGSPYDEIRNKDMMALGWSIARFWFADCLQDTETVLETIAAIIDGRIDESVKSREFSYFSA